MSQRCHVCGPVKHEATKVICASCAFREQGHREHVAESEASSGDAQGGDGRDHGVSTGPTTRCDGDHAPPICGDRQCWRSSGPSIYHVARQNDGRGWMLLELDAIGPAQATIVAVDLTEPDARGRLADLRAAEVAPPRAPFCSPWRLDDGLSVVRYLESALAVLGWHFALTGGVLLRGSSEHDLDVVVYPEVSGDGIDATALRAALRGLGWTLYESASVLAARWRANGRRDRKHVDVWATDTGRRVDMIIPTCEAP